MNTNKNHLREMTFRHNCLTIERYTNDFLSDYLSDKMIEVNDELVNELKLYLNSIIDKNLNINIIDITNNSFNIYVQNKKNEYLNATIEISLNIIKEKVKG